MKIRFRSASAVSLLFVAASATTAHAADVKELFEPRVFANGDSKTLNYRLLKPEPYDQSQLYPLVLLLHGAGERGDDNLAQLQHGAEEFVRVENRRRYPCFVVVPQSPKGKSWSTIKEKKMVSGAEPSEPMQRVIELLDALPREFSIDRGRIYVTGLSMGGYGTWDLVQRFPDRFAAAAPICGGGDPLQAAKLVKLPLWVFHGADDNGNSPDLSRTMVAAIRQAGGNPLYTEYPGVGHNAWDPTYQSPLFMTWLFAQRRAEK